MKQVKKTKQKSHSFVSAIIVTLLLLIGLSLLLYPTAADYINSLNYRQDIENYQRELFELDDSERQVMLEAAHSYNTALLDRSARIGELDAAQRRTYESLLDPSGTGMMGYIEIEKAKIYLPICHGIGESVLQAGAAECISPSFSDFMIRFRIENILLLHADESSMKEYAKKFVEERYSSTETIKEILDCVRDNCL